MSSPGVIHRHYLPRTRTTCLASREKVDAIGHACHATTADTTPVPPGFIALRLPFDEFGLLGHLLSTLLQEGRAGNPTRRVLDRIELGLRRPDLFSIRGVASEGALLGALGECG